MSDLKSYDVIVTRDTTESTTIRAQARDSGEAESLAWAMSFEGEHVWKQDDTPNASRHHYTNGAEEVDV